MARRSRILDESDKQGRERERLRLMRAARSKVEYSHGIGGLIKGKGHRRAPITLAPSGPKMTDAEFAESVKGLGPVLGPGGPDHFTK